MAFTKRELKQLHDIITITSSLLEKAEAHVSAAEAVRAEKAANKRVRRSGKELTKFRRELKRLRNESEPVAQLSSDYGVSTSYIYQL